MPTEKGNNTLEISGTPILPGERKRVEIPIGRLPTGTLIDIPVYVFNAENPGPVLLVQAGLHGDEINGVEVVRRMLQKNLFRVTRGAVMAVPVLNIYGFIHFSRDMPDGKDVNRSFPGSEKGSLAKRMAYHYQEQVMRQMDLAVDLHTGGAQRSNYPQVRYTPGDPQSQSLAEAFGAPLYFGSKLIRGSFRKAAHDMGKPTIIYEAGESKRFDEQAIREGVQGILQLMRHLEMIHAVPALYAERYPSVHVAQRRWLRSPMAGMFIPEVINGSQVSKGATLGMVTDTYAQREKKIRAPYDGVILALNHQAVVNQGDALFHIGHS
ncbi:succinylglutamate desuccinylase/aspartoacylase family protein [Robiginitalea sediminis]|uniref:succinylglutamate desuccinylase/aspartoacylase family protein n=1 Tax=Robiginitalea sediminis TaxID=1982593 RepID=UPI000B4BEBF8|nr:succinylglutamate desuccinylase/aspartoacylase family protein [Robiginitalea sediminis]